MVTISLSILKYRMTYVTVISAVLIMNVLAYLQSSMLAVSRPVSGYILPTAIGFLIGVLLSSNRVNYLEKDEERKRFFVTIVHSLSIALDERDAYTFGHSSRVTSLSMALGKRLGLNAIQLEMLELGSILHDIGKIGIPDTILNKPEKLTAEEQAMIYQHPIKGERIIGLERTPKIGMLVDCIRSHHERYDGKGYPDGLAQENIPVLARIITIADAYDAMTSLRPYRSKVAPDAALEELKLCAGSQFDPEMVKAFSELVREDKDFLLLSEETPSEVEAFA